MSAPIFSNASKIPILYIFTPTLIILILELGTIAAATIAKDAEEISPGTSTSLAISRLPPLIKILLDPFEVLLNFISAPK